MVHVPLAVSEKFRGKSGMGLFGDVMMEIDWSVGEILKALEKYGISENTLVIFTSDNGPWLNYGNHGGSAGGLREGKNTVFEGGFRMVCVMLWPFVIPAGAVCDRMASSIDILPTLAAITGSDLPESPVDGVNIFPLLTGDFNENPRTTFYFYSDKALNAVRWHHWKLIMPHAYNSNAGSLVGHDGWPGIMNRVHFKGGLFDLRRDPGERYHVEEEYPEIVKKLEGMAGSMKKRLGDSLSDIPGEECRAPGRVQTEL
jgi:arylsulfatase